MVITSSADHFACSRSVSCRSRFSAGTIAGHVEGRFCASDGTQNWRVNGFWEGRWAGMRQRISNGAQFMPMKEFSHPRILASMAGTSRSSRETPTKVELQVEEISVLPFKTPRVHNDLLQRTMESTPHALVPRSGQGRAAKVTVRAYPGKSLCPWEIKTVREKPACRPQSAISLGGTFARSDWLNR